MLKVIFFDIDDTLLSFSGYVRDALQKGFAEFSIMPYDEHVYATFEQINSGLWHKLEDGKITFEALKARRFNDVFAALGANFDGPAFEAYFRGALHESAIEMPDAMDVLRALHGQYILCTASNGPYEQQIHRLTIAGMLPLFSHVFVSEDIGFSKPDKRFFEECLRRINLDRADEIEPSDCLMVGDSVTSDIGGGLNAGMKTCLYNPENKPLRGKGQADMEIHALQELIHL